MNDNFGLYGNFSWRHFDKDGKLLDEGGTDNRICDTLRQVFTAVSMQGSCATVKSMAIGTGNGQDVTSNALASLATVENHNDGASAGSHWSASQPSAGRSQFITTFTAADTWTITEAGLFLTYGSTASMVAYNDALNVPMTSGDTLQGTWTILTYS